MKKLYFGSNLKMYKGIAQTEDYLLKLAASMADIDLSDKELFIIPSYTSLPDVSRLEGIDCIRIGAQNMGWEDEGQFTGEISAPMLEEIGIRFVMIGHSERRHVLGETDEMENLKVKQALKHGFLALLCIGETAEEKENGLTEEVLRTQIKIGFKGVDPSQTGNLWVAYEPVWSIGVNGTPATADYAEKAHQMIKRALYDQFGDAAAKIPVLYGGSVNPGNANELIVCPSIDGLFVGRSAWDADRFHDLIKSAILTYEASIREQ